MCFFAAKSKAWFARNIFYGSLRKISFNLGCSWAFDLHHSHMFKVGMVWSYGVKGFHLCSNIKSEKQVKLNKMRRDSMTG